MVNDRGRADPATPTDPLEAINVTNGYPGLVTAVSSTNLGNYRHSSNSNRAVAKMSMIPVQAAGASSQEVIDIELQADAFGMLCDVRSDRLRVPIAYGQGREALLRLNVATEATFNALDSLKHFSTNSTLGRGACLIVAVLKELDLLESTWCGPPAELSRHAVKVMQQFTKKTGTQVIARLRYAVKHWPRMYSA